MITLQNNTQTKKCHLSATTSLSVDLWGAHVNEKRATKGGVFAKKNSRKIVLKLGKYGGILVGLVSGNPAIFRQFREDNAAASSSVKET